MRDGPILLADGNTRVGFRTSASTIRRLAQPGGGTQIRTALALILLGLTVGTPAAFAGTAPPGATARCNDGTYSFSQHHSGTCSHHGGVATWLDGTAQAPGTLTHGSQSAAAVFPTAKAAYYDQRLTVARVSHAPSALSDGYESGARASYSDKGVGRPRATVSLYLYSSTSEATAAFEASCPPSQCNKSSVAAKLGISLRFRQLPNSGRAKCFFLTSVREQVVVLVNTCAAVADDGKPYSIAKLKYDASFLVGLFQSRAKQLL